MIWPSCLQEHYTSLLIVYPRWILPQSVFSWNAPHLCVEEQRRLLMISGKPCAPGIHVINSVLHPFWQDTPLTSTHAGWLETPGNITLFNPGVTDFSWFVLLIFSCVHRCLSLPFHFSGNVFAASIEEHTWTHLCHTIRNLHLGTWIGGYTAEGTAALGHSGSH